MSRLIVESMMLKISMPRAFDPVGAAQTLNKTTPADINRPLPRTAIDRIFMPPEDWRYRKNRHLVQPVPEHGRGKRP